MVTVERWLRDVERQLGVAGISTARLDALVLLEDALNINRTQLLANPDSVISVEILKLLDEQISRRVQHVPLAYIRGRSEFYGREFIVNEHTLVPRPESETMIEMLKLVSNMESSITSWEDGGRRSKRSRKPARLATPTKQASSLVQTDEGFKVVWEATRTNRQKTAHKSTSSKPVHLIPNDEELCIIDVGTGSGALAITAKLEHPDAQVFATDIDDNCLAIAKQNTHSLDADVTFYKGNLLEPIYSLQSKIYPLVLLCNLPYVPDNFQINTAATHEPHHAIFGGSDGLDLYRELFEQITSNNDWKPAYILTESMPPQHEVLAEIATAHGYKLSKTDDFIQLFNLQE